MAYYIRHTVNSIVKETSSFVSIFFFPDSHRFKNNSMLEIESARCRRASSFLLLLNFGPTRRQLQTESAEDEEGQYNNEALDGIA
jgi:hypothetical protein